MTIFDYQFESQLATLEQILITNKQKEIVFFCVGNHKVWYDCFGPTLAEKLRKENVSFFIYGGESCPILPDNLTSYMNFVEVKHPNALVVVVDSCLLTDFEKPNSLSISMCKTKPAYFFGEIPSFGNVSILFKMSPWKNFDAQKSLLIAAVDKLSTLITKFDVKIV